MSAEHKNEIDRIEQLEAETIQAIIKGQKQKVQSLYKKVEQIFNAGTDFTRAIISNRFILPLSQLMEMNYSWGREYLLMFPKGLKSEYHRQVYSSGI